MLITGESGVGKELFARAIHGSSKRSGQAFIAVNCGAIPENLVESTLFGHEKGSFTGAINKNIGKFREAEGGTIFLDEVGELPLETQVKLLRVLQQKEVEPVGAANSIPINVRIISATNRDLEEEVKSGTFREDLYFRLNVLQLELCALRERREDIPALAAHFIERFCAREGLPFKDLSTAALVLLKQNDWPGNVRQLENTIHRAMVVVEGNIIDADDFKTLPPSITPQNHFPVSPASVFMSETGTLKPLERIEQDAIHFALAHFDGNITKAAEALGMAKSTFYKKIKS